MGSVLTQSLLAGVIHAANVYDFTHYSFHQYDLKFPFQFMQDYYDDLKAIHMVHHWRDNTKGFGITCKWTDWMFGTVHTSIVNTKEKT